MKKRLLIGIAITLLSGYVAVSADQPSPQDVLKKALQADQTAQYQATGVSWAWTDGKQISARVRIYRSGTRSRVEYLSGPLTGMVMLDDGKTVETLMPGCGCPSVRENAASPNVLNTLLANHTAKLVGSDTIASRSVYVVELLPKIKGNPSSKLWIDKSTFVILRNDRYSADGKMVSSTRFDKVDYSARPSPALFRRPGTGAIAVKPYENLADVRDIVGFAPIKPGYVPRGYSFGGYYISRTLCGRSLVVLKYTNGLNVISIAEGNCPCVGGACPMRGHGPRRRAGHGPAVCLLSANRQARVFRNTVGDISIVVTGNVADNELRKIAASFQ